MVVSSPLLRSPPRSPVPKQSSATATATSMATATSPALLTPLSHDKATPRSATSINTVRMQQSPLKVAASLIQSLDIAHTEMSSFAADAAADAEKARKNARTAQEIARRYQNRIYPSFQTERSANSAAASSDESDVLAAATLTSPFTASGPPKRPEARRFHTYLTPRTKANSSEEKVDGSENDQGDEGNTKIKEDDEDTKRATPCEKSSAKKNLEAPHSPTPYSNGKKLLTPKSPSPSPNRYRRNKNRLVPQSPTSYERLAKHHADDLLQLSMELEQAKQALKSEQRSNEESKMALEAMKTKKTKAEKAYQKLVLKQGKEQQESTAQISNLERELEVSRLRLQAAEEDAELALDLAKDSAEQRDQMEESLMKLRKEMETLQANRDGNPPPAMTTPKRSVHFADTTDGNTDDECKTTTTPEPLKEKESPIFHTPRENGPPRSMIAAGRQLLLRRNMTPKDAVIRLEVSPAKSAERRQQLYQRLNQHLNENGKEDSSLARLSSSPSRTPLSPTPGRTSADLGDVAGGLVTKKKLEEYSTAMKILQISGKRLQLDGYWWREQNSKVMPSNENPVQIDIIARQYCQNVEFKINRQQKDINQLESLCGYLEKKLFLDGGESGS